VKRAALLFAFAFAVQAGSIPSGYVLDDAEAVVENPVVNGSLPLLAAFNHDFWGRRVLVGTYRPLAVVSLGIDYRLGGGRAWVLHAVNALLHALVVAAAYLAFRATGGEHVAVAAAGFFAVFAAPAEAVQSIVGRGDVLLALFALIGLIAHRAPGQRGALLAAAALLAACGAKESALLVPAAWLALDLALPSAAPPRRRRFAIYVCVLVAFVFVRRLALGGWAVRRIEPMRNALAGADPLEHLLGAGRVLAEHYLPGMIDPFRRLYLCSAPECGPASATDPLAWAGLALAAAVAALPLLLFRRSPLGSGGLAWFGLLFLPASNFLVASPSIYAERTLYAPALGLSLALAAAAEALSRRAKPVLAYGAVAVLAVVNAAAVQRRHLDWRTPADLSLSAADLAQRSALVRGNAGFGWLMKGDVDAAEREFRAALALWPGFPEARCGLGQVLDGRGRLAEAESHFLAAVRATTAPVVVTNYAVFLARHRRFREAESFLMAASKREPLRREWVHLLDSVRKAARTDPLRGR